MARRVFILGRPAAFAGRQMNTVGSVPMKKTATIASIALLVLGLGAGAQAQQAAMSFFITSAGSGTQAAIRSGWVWWQALTGLVATSPG